MEIDSGKEGGLESKQGHVGSGVQGRKEIEGSAFFLNKLELYFHHFTNGGHKSCSL